MSGHDQASFNSETRVSTHSLDTSEKEKVVNIHVVKVEKSIIGVIPSLLQKQMHGNTAHMKETPPEMRSVLGNVPRVTMDTGGAGLTIGMKLKGTFVHHQNRCSRQLMQYRD